MLKVWFGPAHGVEDDTIYHPPTYFDNTFDPDWIITDFAKKIILDIDKSVVLDRHCIQSPVLGQIPPVYLSGGVKTLLLMLNEPETAFNISSCGDNCAKWILEVGKLQDVEVSLYHIMDFGDAEFDMQIMHDGSVVHNMIEYIDHALKYLDEYRQRRD